MIVVWSEPRARFEAITSYWEKSLAKENRWRWDSAAKRWYAPSEDIARRLARFAQGPARLRLLGMEDHERAALAASQAEDSDLAIPAPPGLDYLPYQRAGIAYALSRPHTLIGDEMGLGKTIQAIGVVNALGSGDDRRCDLVGCSGNNRDDPDCRGGDVGQHFIAPSRVLIVTPASLRLNWRQEWRKWHTGSLRPYLLDIWPGGGLFDETAGKALIVSYDSVRKWHPQIAAIEWDVLIADEVHLVKDDGTRRAKSIFGGTYQGKVFQPIRARRKLFLSGTPIVNKPAELWPLVKALAPEGLGKSRVDFMTRYGNGAAALDELHVRLRSQIMVRRLKENVLKQLPKKRRQVVLLDVENAEGLLRAEAEVISLQQAALAKTRAEIEGLPHAEQVMRLRQCRAIAMTEIARVRKETAIAKLPAAIEHIHDVLANVDKAIIFAHHHEVLDALCAEFRKISVGFDGRTPLPMRQEAVELFQSDRRYRLFIGGKAAGLGITLVAAALGIFVELQWSPADMDQQESRIHRIGQVNPTLFQHLVIDGSIDAKMAGILIDKQAMMDQALDGGRPEAASRDILQEVMRA